MARFLAALAALAIVAACTTAAKAPPGYVDAHDGMILQVGNTFYRYGTAYDCGFALNTPGTPWCGVRVYSSTDVVHWRSRGFVVPPIGWQQACAPPRFGCFRPHVARSPATGRYVLWLNSFDRPEGYHVLTGPSPLGPFTDGPPPRLAIAASRGDHDLVVDGAGQGWLAYTVMNPDNRTTIAVERLDPTLTTGMGDTVRLGPEMVEAPALFTRSGRWFLTYSDPACPYCGGTGTGLAIAPSPLGPWTIAGRLSEDSCGGQPGAVSHLVVDGQQQWLYQSDLWHDGKANQAGAGVHTEALHFGADGMPAALNCRRR